MKQFYKNWDEKKYFEYLKEFQLPEDKLIKELSSGMKMKLKIATRTISSSKSFNIR